MATEDLATETDYELLKLLVEGAYEDRLAAISELHARVASETIDRAVYRTMGAVRCYDLKECSNLELREVVRWCVNRFGLSLPLWWDDSDEALEDREGMQ